MVLKTTTMSTSVRFERAGATEMNGTTNNDRTNYFENVPTPALDMALWMESDRMGHLLGAVTQEKLDEQRGVVQNEKRQGEAQPYGKAWSYISEQTFPEASPLFMVGYWLHGRLKCGNFGRRPSMV